MAASLCPAIRTRFVLDDDPHAFLGRAVDVVELQPGADGRLADVDRRPVAGALSATGNSASVIFFTHSTSRRDGLALAADRLRGPLRRPSA